MKSIVPLNLYSVGSFIAYIHLLLQVNHSVHIKPLMFTGVPETMAGKTAVFEDKTLCKKCGSGNQRHKQCHTKFGKHLWWCLLNCCQCCWLKVVTVIKRQRSRQGGRRHSERHDLWLLCHYYFHPQVVLKKLWEVQSKPIPQCGKTHGRSMLLSIILHAYLTYEQLQMSMEPTLQCTNVLQPFFHKSAKLWCT